MAEYGGGKKGWLKWILIYLVIGLIVYGAVWYFFLGGSKGGGYSAPNSSGSTPSYTAPKY